MDDNVADLVHAAVDGDEDAWRQLVERYLPLVKSVIRSYGLVGQNAQDVSQIVWLRLVEHLKDLRQPQALPGWIKTTTRNECIQLLRSARRTVPVGASVELETATSGDQEPDTDLLRTERHQALLEALAELPEHQRNLLVLLVADPPLSYAEISRRLSIRVGSIGPTRARALNRLRESPAMAALIKMNTEVTR
ncbi:MAG: RNA polymerase sigma factor [Pseudonocardiaceae bacterium]